MISARAASDSLATFSVAFVSMGPPSLPVISGTTDPNRGHTLVAPKTSHANYRSTYAFGGNSGNGGHGHVWVTCSNGFSTDFGYTGGEQTLLGSTILA